MDESDAPMLMDATIGTRFETADRTQRPVCALAMAGDERHPVQDHAASFVEVRP